MSDYKAQALILLASAAILILMLPLRSQTAGDDFAYAQSARTFAQTNQIKISEWSSPSLIMPIIWGGMFSKALGFSFSTLHISTLVLLPLLLIVIYKIQRLLEISTENSLFLTLFFLSLPWIIQYSYTFLTEIPFLTLEVITIYFYLKGLRENRYQDLTLGSLFATGAILTRQIGILLPLCFALAVLFSSRKPHTIENNLKKVFFATLVPAMAGSYYFWNSQQPQNQTIARFIYTAEIKKTILEFNLIEVFHRLLNFLSQGFGLFSPIIILLYFKNVKKISRFVKNNLMLVSFSLALVVIIYGLDIILFPQKVYLGFPLVLYRYEYLFPIPWPHVWKFLVGLSLPFWAIILSIGISRWRRTTTSAAFLILVFCAITVSSIVTVFNFPKYIIPALPFFALATALAAKNLQIEGKIGYVLIIFLIVSSLQMAKLRYDENGIAQQKAYELKNSGICHCDILPNLEYTWSIWFDFENKAAEEIKKAGGDKKKAVLPLPGDKQTYWIISERNLEGNYLKGEWVILEEIPFKSLFINSKLVVLKRQ
ncbi:MAG: glycosyltransferase family 39 protein [Candidatus Curtissbacteria bacterium]|nr:glycosyltransferase family 39 protein [Candidatus Curtissbacteria bacterium]